MTACKCSTNCTCPNRVKHLKYACYACTCTYLTKLYVQSVDVIDFKLKLPLLKNRYAEKCSMLASAQAESKKIKAYKKRKVIDTERLIDLKLLIKTLSSDCIDCKKYLDNFTETDVVVAAPCQSRWADMSADERSTRQGMNGCCTSDCCMCPKRFPSGVWPVPDGEMSMVSLKRTLGLRGIGFNLGTLPCAHKTIQLPCMCTHVCRCSKKFCKCSDICTCANRIYMVGPKFSSWSALFNRSSNIHNKPRISPCVCYDRCVCNVYTYHEHLRTLHSDDGEADWGDFLNQDNGEIVQRLKAVNSECFCKDIQDQTQFGMNFKTMKRFDSKRPQCTVCLNNGRAEVDHTKDTQHSEEPIPLTSDLLKWLLDVVVDEVYEMGVVEHSKAGDNLYTLLGVQTNESFRTIKESFHHLALKYHPDKFSTGAAEKDGLDKHMAEELFKKINNAYEVLGNEDLRKTYDETNIDPNTPITRTRELVPIPKANGIVRKILEELLECTCDSDVCVCDHKEGAIKDKYRVCECLERGECLCPIDFVEYSVIPLPGPTVVILHHTPPKSDSSCRLVITDGVVDRTKPDYKEAVEINGKTYLLKPVNLERKKLRDAAQSSTCLRQCEYTAGTFVGVPILPTGL